MKIAAIVTDIEGTTSSIGFVHDVLSPYLLSNLGKYIRANKEERDVSRVLGRLSKTTGIPRHDVNGMIELLELWTRDEESYPDLKILQGMVLEKAYKQGLFQAPVYEDVPPVLQLWLEKELNIYAFSSESVKSQQLFFRFSHMGDLRLLFSGYFDSQMGEKRSEAAYRNIAQAIALPPERILYLSDCKEELDCAKEVGFMTCWLVRPQDTSLDPERARVKSPHQVVTSFNQIQL
ncbi:MAG: acireductone synthase [Pseudohongiellaceae bacterium]|nr:acireductone synthase [Pseudohongiellaceae bacterium]